MTLNEKLVLLSSLLANDPVVPSQELLTAYLKMAEQEILSWRYSYGTAPTEVPAEFEITQIYAVLAGLSNAGAEGETNHSENGISRTFRYDSMLAYIHANVRPICKVV
jgi:hypothetical protein